MTALETHWEEENALLADRFLGGWELSAAMSGRVAAQRPEASRIADWPASFWWQSKRPLAANLSSARVRTAGMPEGRRLESCIGFGHLLLGVGLLPSRPGSCGPSAGLEPVGVCLLQPSGQMIPKVAAVCGHVRVLDKLVVDQ